jgi:predicted solute-binding protein
LRHGSYGLTLRCLEILGKMSYTLSYTYLKYPSDVKTIKIEFANILICIVKSQAEARVTIHEIRNFPFQSLDY